MLLLDEPLAGLDWRARAELAETLKRLKPECTILVVSHDLRELTPLVIARLLADCCSACTKWHSTMLVVVGHAAEAGLLS